jgi:hypothetical protein
MPDLRIRQVEFADSDSDFGDREARVRLEDETSHVAFAWFSDELSFEKSDLMGLTLSQARDLKVQRDIQYLQS